MAGEREWGAPATLIVKRNVYRAAYRRPDKIAASYAEIALRDSLRAGWSKEVTIKGRDLKLSKKLTTRNLRK
jgi:hypothetical protein